MHMLIKPLPINYQFIQVIKKKERTYPVQFFSWLYNDQKVTVTFFYKPIIFFA